MIKQQQQKLRFTKKTTLFVHIPVVASVLTLLLFTLAVHAFAEEFTVDVPFDVKGWGCYGYEPTDTRISLHCTFTGYLAEFTPDDDNQGQTISPIKEETTTEDIAGEIAPVIEVIEPPKELTREEKILQRLVELDERDELNPTQQELKLALEAKKRTCDFGTEEGKRVQDEAYIDIPVNIIELAKNPDYSTNVYLGNLKKTTLACELWDLHKGTQLGPEYLNRIDDAEKAEQEALARIAYLESLTHQYDAPLSRHDLLEEEETAYGDLCTLGIFGDATKVDYGCKDVIAPDNRGGFVDISEHPINLEYLKSQETGEIAENPREIAGVFVSPDVVAFQYYEAYGYVPDEMMKELTNAQKIKLIEKIAEHLKSQEQGGG